MAVALGLASVPPDPFRAGGCLVGCMGCGLSWRVSCWRLYCCPCASVGCVGLFIGCPAALCLGGGGGVLVACRRGSVGVRCLGVGGVRCLSGLHPLPFLLLVLVFGVLITCTRFRIVTKEKTKKAKETENYS